ncbi:MAG: phage tail protein [Rhizobiales bacterium]|nr:phage tail protein [Hyphomicrobiales bacterium]
MSTTGLLITNAGAAAILADLSGGTNLVLSHVAWGDSNGAPYNPVATQTALVREKYRATIASMAVVDGAIVVDAILPADTNDASARPSHGFNVAECGLFSSDGTMIGVARMGNGFKPAPASGQAVTATYRLKLAVANPGAITVQIDAAQQVHLGRMVRPFFLAIDDVLNAPPASPTPGATYVVGAAPTGAWTGFAHYLAQWIGVWVLTVAPVGHVVVDQSEPEGGANRYLRRTAGGWVSAAASDTAFGVSRRATAGEVAAAADVNAYATPADVASTVRTTKAPFNLAQAGNSTRTTYASLTGWQTVMSGTYNKTSATSLVDTRIVTNLLSNASFAAGLMRLVFNSVNGKTHICVNMTASSNATSPHGNDTFAGVPTGAISWSLQIGRVDGNAWTSVWNPDSTNSSNLPSLTETVINFQEREP